MSDYFKISLLFVQCLVLGFTVWLLVKFWKIKSDSDWFKTKKHLYHVPAGTYLLYLLAIIGAVYLLVSLIMGIFK